MNIRAVKPEDASQMAEIYNYYVENTTITFEEQMVSSDDFCQRIKKVADAGLPWLVAESESGIVGYIYVSPWHSRSAYRFTVESSLYLSVNSRGNGIGHQLFLALFRALDETPVRHIISVVALPNERSVGLHQKLGFRKAGEMEKIGFKLDRLISVGYWQYSLKPE